MAKLQSIHEIMDQFKLIFTIVSRTLHAEKNNFLNKWKQDKVQPLDNGTAVTWKKRKFLLHHTMPKKKKPK